MVKFTNNSGKKTIILEKYWFNFDVKEEDEVLNPSVSFFSTEPDAMTRIWSTLGGGLLFIFLFVFV